MIWRIKVFYLKQRISERISLINLYFLDRPYIYLWVVLGYFFIVQTLKAGDADEASSL